VSYRFLLDENVPRSVFRYLKSRGYQVEYVPRGIDDNTMIKLADRRQAVLITRDSDFADETVYAPEEHCGIVVLRIHPPKPRDLVEVLESVLTIIKDFKGRIVIVYRDRIELIEGIRRAHSP